jgi:hypothetical protein
MSAAPVPAVAVVVLAARGDARLARALASVAWAAERLVLDPAGRVDPGGLPPGVRHATDAAALPADVSAPWVLLLAEDEVVCPALAAEIAAATAAPEPPTALCLPLELHAFGTRLRVRGRPVRLARRAGVRLGLGRSLSFALDASGGRRGALGAPLIVEPAASLGEAVEDVDHQATVVAMLLDAAGHRARVVHMVAGSLWASGRAFAGRAKPGLGWGRWIITVLAGYRAVVAYAKLWERQRSRAVRA